MRGLSAGLLLAFLFMLGFLARRAARDRPVWEATAKAKREAESRRRDGVAVEIRKLWEGGREKWRLLVAKKKRFM